MLASSYLAHEAHSRVSLREICHGALPLLPLPLLLERGCATKGLALLLLLFLLLEPLPLLPLLELLELLPVDLLPREGLPFACPVRLPADARAKWRASTSNAAAVSAA